MERAHPHISAPRAVRWIEAAASVLAVAGGVVLVLIAGVTLAGVTGRAIDWLPALAGDYELVEMGTAVAVMCALPWCQISGGQVRVDVLSALLGARTHAVLGLVGQIALGMLSAVVFWRLWLGFGEKMPFGGAGVRAALGLGPPPWFVETSFDLMIPVWVPFALCLPGAALWVLACAVGVARAWSEVRR